MQTTNSVVSHSLSQSAHSDSRREIISGTYMALDATFPILEQYIQNAVIPSILYYLIMVYQLIQFCVFSTWHYFFDNHDSALEILSKVVFWIDPHSDDDINIIFFVFLAIFVLEYANFFIMHFHYAKTRKWSTICLTIVRIFVDIVHPLSWFPAAALIGRIFLKVITDVTGLDIVFLAVSIIMLISFVSMTTILSYFPSLSLYLPCTVTGTWSFSFVQIYSLSAVLFTFLQFFLRRFSNWVGYVAIVLNILTNVYLVYHTFFLPYIQTWVNSFYASIFIAGIGCMLVNVINEFVEIPSFIIWSIWFLIFVISLPITHIINQKRIRYIVEQLTTDEDTESMFAELDFTRSTIQATMWLHVALAERLPCMVDFSIIKHLSADPKNVALVASSLQVLSFFPGESRLTNFIFNLLLHQRNLTLCQRFLLFQLTHIKSLRQSSSSLDVTEHLNQLVIKTNMCISEVIGFWKNLPDNPDVFHNLGPQIVALNDHWLELITSYPNNFRVREEYGKFQIECQMDFTGGIHSKYQASMIDQGKTYAVDLPFVRFVRTYPYYLKRKVIDLRGNIITQKTANQSSRKSASQGSSSSQNSMNYLSDGQIDIEHQEIMARSLFSHGRMRLAMQSVLTVHRAHGLFGFFFTNMISLLLTLACIVTCFVILFNHFESSVEKTQEVYALNKLFQHIRQCEFSSILRWADGRGLITNTEYALELNALDGVTDSFFDGRYQERQQNISNDMGNALAYMQTTVAQIAANGNDVYNIAANFVNSVNPFPVCYGNTQETTINTSVQEQMSRVFVIMRNLAMDDNPADWHLRSPEFCELIISARPMRALTQTVASSFSSQVSDSVDDHEDLMFLLLLIFPAGLFVLDGIMIILGHLIVHKEQKHIMELMSKAEASYKAEAADTIMKTESDTDDKFGAMQTKTNKKLIVHPISMGFGIFVISMLVFGQLFYSYSVNHNAFYIYRWMTAVTERTYEIMAARNGITMSVVFEEFPATNFDYQSGRGRDAAGRFQGVNRLLMSGADGIPSILGFDDRFDLVQAGTTCPDPDTSSLHDILVCGSIDQILEITNSLYDHLYNTLGEETSIRSEEYYTYEHAINQHLFTKFSESEELLLDISRNFSDTHDMIILIFVAIQMVGCLFELYFFLTTFAAIKTTYACAFNLFRRIPPHGFVTNPELLDYILKRKTDKAANEMSTAQSVLHSSEDAILLTNKNLIIEVANKSVTNMLGYTLEQLLGQPLFILFDQESTDILTKQCELMQGGQAALSFQAHVNCFNDNDESILCNSTIIGMTDGRDKCATSFVIMLRDETALMKQQEEAEIAKKQSEELLYHILPRDIVIRINQGETNISFSVPSSTIIFIDIQRFSDFSAALTPAQIMGTLSMVFQSFDKSLSKYQHLIKIKLIGDVYMAAGGIFSPDEPPQTHAEQMTRFAIDCLSDLEDVNMKMGASLQVRIGINTGGPLLAGVLGTDKPAFDIIGDPINVAARLQSTDIAGRIQISQATYDLICDLDFSIEKRGEIFLKGKGKSVAYLVSPSHQFSYMISGPQSIDSMAASRSEISAE